MDVSENIKLEVKEILEETDKAWQIKILTGIHWFPKSQCRLIGNYIYIPKWLAIKNEVNYEDIKIN